MLRALGAVEIPVLRRTVEELGRLREHESRLVARDISRILLHDPMFSLRVLRFLSARPKHFRSREITTLEHALMMLGVSPFFAHFNDLPTVESTLADFPLALDGLMRVINRARHAALYARDWAGIRHDTESEEVVIAALLHDLAEMLLWCFAPGHALRIGELLHHEPAMRSIAAQRSVLGFTLIELQRELISAWKLPDLLRFLMDGTHDGHPRAINVVLAVDLARHSACGWDDPALPDDFAAIMKFLGLPQQEVLERIRRTNSQSDNESNWYHPETALAQKKPESGPSGIQE